MSVRTSNSFEVEAPFDFVWERLNDVEGWPKLFSEYAAVEIIERRGHTVSFRLTTHPDPEHNDQVWSWVSERTVDQSTRSVRAHRVETGPFEFMNIAWLFEPTDSGVRVQWDQEFSMKPTAPANNEQARDYINRNTRLQMDVIKNRLEAEAAALA